MANDTVQNFLFHNKGEGQVRGDRASLSGVAFDQSGSPRGGMGIDWACFKNDERLGLAIGNFANEMTALYVCRPAGEPAVLRPGQPLRPGRPDAAAAEVRPLLLRLRPRRPARPALGQRPPRARHLQGPGQRDLRAAGAALLEHGQSRAATLFPQVGPETAGPDLFQPIVGRGSAYADIDGDGDLDVVLTVNNGPARLFRNDGGNANHWLRLDLTGNGKTSNRDAIGAKVELKVGDQVCRRQLFPAKSYLSSVELPLTFGLGKADKADEVTITWPSGKVTKLSDLKANQVHAIDEDSGPKAK